MKILIFPQKSFPCQHAALETVFAQFFPGQGCEVTWVMHGAAETKGKWVQWRDSTVRLIRNPSWLRQIRVGQLLVTQILLRMTHMLMCFSGKYHILQVRNSVGSGIIALVAARICGARFVYQFSYPIPEGLIKSAKEGRTRYPLILTCIAQLQIRLRNIIINRADLVLAISETMRQQLATKCVSPERVITFPLGTDCPDLPDENILHNLQTHFDLVGYHTIVYVGTIIPERELEFLLRSVSIVRHVIPKLKLLLVGPVKELEKRRLTDIARKLYVDECIYFVGKVPRIEVSSYFCVAELSVSPIPTTQLFMISSPTKTVESLSVGCPVVCTSIPDQKEIVESCGGGNVAEYEENAFANAIVDLLNDPQRSKRGIRGMAYVRKHRNYKILGQSLYDRYISLIK